MMGDGALLVVSSLSPLCHKGEPPLCSYQQMKQRRSLRVMCQAWWLFHHDRCQVWNNNACSRIQKNSRRFRLAHTAALHTRCTRSLDTTLSIFKDQTARRML